MFVFVLLGKVKWGFKDYPIIIPLCFLHMNYLLPLIIMTIIISWSWWCDNDGRWKWINQLIYFMGTYGKRYKGLMVVGPLNKNGTFWPTASKKVFCLVLAPCWQKCRNIQSDINFWGFIAPPSHHLGSSVQSINFSQPKCLHIFAPQFCDLTWLLYQKRT